MISIKQWLCHWVRLGFNKLLAEYVMVNALHAYQQHNPFSSHISVNWPLWCNTGPSLLQNHLILGRQKRVGKPWAAAPQRLTETGQCQPPPPYCYFPEARVGMVPVQPILHPRHQQAATSKLLSQPQNQPPYCHRVLLNQCILVYFGH